MEDIDLSLDDFVARVNSDLVGKYVNIASRCAGFLNRFFDGKLASTRQRSVQGIPDLALQGAAEIEDEVRDAYEGREFGKALRLVMQYADRINQFIDEHKPWELAKSDDQRARVITSYSIHYTKLYDCVHRSLHRRSGVVKKSSTARATEGSAGLRKMVRR